MNQSSTVLSAIILPGMSTEAGAVFEYSIIVGPIFPNMMTEQE